VVYCATLLVSCCGLLHYTARILVWFTALDCQYLIIYGVGCYNEKDELSNTWNDVVVAEFM